MSRRANPTFIGMFIIGAAAIAVAGTALLAGTRWFRNRTRLESHFRESVNGLVVGAPVKFQGVPVGIVTRMRIQLNQTDRAFEVPVEYEVNTKQLRTPSGTFVDLEDRDVVAAQIAEGLRAQLQMESLVTGQLYIELTYRKDAKPPLLQTTMTDYPEIPTTPSMMAALGSGAGSVLADVVNVLHRVNDMLVAVDMKTINASVVATAKSMQRLADAPEIREALKEVPIMTDQLVRTLARFDTLAAKTGATMDPMANDLRGAAREMNATMASLHKTLDDTHGLLSTDSGLGYGLESALAGMRDATNALRLLINALDQNPDMLLRGKRPPGPIKP